MLNNPEISSAIKGTIDLNNSNNKENLTDVLKKNLEEEKNKISPSSPVYIFCKSLKEINTPNENGWTPIYRSIIANNNLALIELLKLGADPNIPNNLGETPLYLCVDNQNYDSLMKLLEYNADANLAKKNGITPLHLAIKKKLENKYIIGLLNNNANPNILNKLYNQTATHLALINKSDEEILKILNNNKADIYGIKDKYDKTPFDYVKDLNDDDYLNKVINIFGKEKENTKCNNSIKLIEINLDDDFLNDKFTNINNNNYVFDKNNDLFNNFELELNQQKFSLDYNIDNILNNNNDKNNNGNISKIANNKNINNINNDEITNNNEIIKEISNSKKNNPLTLNIVDNNYLLNSLNNIDKLNKKNNNSETKNIISLPDYLKIENNNNNNIKEKIDIMYKFINNSDYQTKNKNIINNNNNNEKSSEKKNIPNLLSNNKLNTESLCYSISKEISEAKNQTQNKKEVENENDIDMNNKNYTNTSETDKEIIKTIISATAKKLKNSNNKSDDILNIENKKINIDKNIENNIFTPEIINILDNNDDKIKLNEMQRSRTSSFVINSKSKEEKINENKIINKDKEDNLTSITNNSNIFSELQMNSTISNLNKTKIDDDTLKDKDNENKISKINTNNTNNTTNINKINSIQNKETIGGEGDFEINLSISNFNDIQNQNINKQKTKEIEIIKKENKKEIKNNKNINYNLNKKIINENDKNKIKKTEIISKNQNQSQNNNNNHHRQISYHNNCNNKKNKNENDKEKSTINNEEENLTDITNKILNMLKEERNSDKIINNKNKENENPNKIKIYHNKNFLAKDRNNLNKCNSFKKINNTTRIISSYKDKKKYNYYKYDNNNYDDDYKSRSINKTDNKILYNKQKIGRHSSPEYNFNNQYSNKGNLTTDNSYKNNISYISILNKNSNNKINNNLNRRKKLNDKYPLYNPYDSFEENSNKNNNSHIIMYKNKNIFNKKKIIYEGNTLNNTTYSSFYNNTSRNYIKPSIFRNSIKTNSFSNNSNCNSYRNSNNKNILINDNSNNSNNSNNNTYLKNTNFNNFTIKPHRTISNTLLIRLRDWLISCDLLCYYNILIKNNMYNIDRYIDDIRYNKISISFKDIEELGIKKPGHIFRLLLKLEVDSGKIDNNLYNYIIEKFNINTITNNGVLTSSINDIRCCGLNCCSTNNNYNNNKRQLITNSNIYNDHHYIPNYNNYYEENRTNESEDESGENEINYIDIFSFLKINNLWKFKENFIHNGFDQIEYILIQLFSDYYFDKNILNDYMHIYLEEDKNIVLKVLYKEKKKLCNLLGIQYNNEQLKQILLSQPSSAEYYNNYMNSVISSNPTNHNNNSCCVIY